MTSRQSTVIHRAHLLVKLDPSWCLPNEGSSGDQGLLRMLSKDNDSYEVSEICLLLLRETIDGGVARSDVSTT